MPSALKLLNASIRRKALEEEKAERSHKAWFKWWTMIRCLRFAAKMILIHRRNRYVEIIKDAIINHSQGYQLRYSMKMYLQRMKFLQFCMRTCTRLRKHLRQNLYMPTLWEVETTILAEVIGMPKSVADAEIEK